MSKQGWIGVDMDGTLAHYEGWDDGRIGRPIPAMVERVKAWLAEGKEVRIFTARVGASGLANGTGQDDDHEWANSQRGDIAAWCLEHIGQILTVTATKDFGMVELWDDRCIQVEKNTGRRVDGIEDWHRCLKK